MGKGALCPNLNVFGFLSCRYAYAHDKKSKEYTENAGITSKNGRNDAKRLNINVVTVTNDDKMKKRKTQ